MLRRICRQCGMDMQKELTPEGARFFCGRCEGYTPFDEFDMEPYCPVCDGQLEFCAKCGQSYFCNRCNGIVSSRNIVWKSA